jgi:putative spermidine/putrescine transport system permease protein
VVFPAIRPAVLATFAVTFAVSIGSFGVLLVLSPRHLTVLPLEIFTRFVAPPTDRAAAAAMSSVLLALALLAGMLVRRLSRAGEPSRA